MYPSMRTYVPAYAFKSEYVGVIAESIESKYHNLLRQDVDVFNFVVRCPPHLLERQAGLHINHGLMYLSRRSCSYRIMCG